MSAVDPDRDHHDDGYERADKLVGHSSQRHDRLSKETTIAVVCRSVSPGLP
jgi:hypothetical protein